MRRDNHHQHKTFGYVAPESAIPKDHPLRPIKNIEARASSKRCLSEGEHLSGSWQAGARRSPEASLRGEKRKKDPHGSLTDPDSPRYKEGEGAEDRSRYAGFTSIDSVLWWMEK